MFSDCPNPKFSNWTKTSPNPIKVALGDEVSVSCMDGYIFQQEPHINETMVTIKCEASGWNATLLPNCLRKYSILQLEVTNLVVEIMQLFT